MTETLAAVVAHHEEGHAVISVRVGVTLCFATIMPNPEKKNLGHTSTAYSCRKKDDWGFSNFGEDEDRWAGGCCEMRRTTTLRIVVSKSSGSVR
jgi:hypothetical protein